MYKKTIDILAEVVALVRFDLYCKKLDTRFKDALNYAFEGERISKERIQRIVDKFLKKLHEVK